jgi:hypothetical protein
MLGLLGLPVRVKQRRCESRKCVKVDIFTVAIDISVPVMIYTINYIDISLQMMKYVILRLY